MTTTGQQLVNNSSASAGSTALEHLLAQQGGSGGGNEIIVAGEINVEKYSITVTNNEQISVQGNPVIHVELDTEAIVSNEGIGVQ